MIEPAIAAAIVTASGSLIGKLLDLAGKREPTARATEVIDKTYDNKDPFLDGMNYLLEGVVGSIT